MHRTDKCVKCLMVRPGYNRHGAGHHCFNCARKAAYPKIRKTCSCGCGTHFEAGYDFRLKRYSEMVAGHNEKKFITKEDVVALYVGKGVTQQETADALKVSRTVLKMRFKEFGLKARTQSECRIGPRNAMWVGAPTRYFRGPGWFVIREKVRKRDKVCRICGSSPKELGYELCVHHIEPYRISGDNRMSNLAALCRCCHRLIEAV